MDKKKINIYIILITLSITYVLCNAIIVQNTTTNLFFLRLGVNKTI